MVLFAGLAIAGAWVRDPWEAYGKVAGGGFWGPTRIVSASAYGELGLPAAFQLAAYVPYVASSAETGGVPYRRSAMGDAVLTLSRRVTAAPPIACSVGAKVPLYRELEGYGALTPRFPLPGDGQVDLDARVDAGTPFQLGARWGWAQAGVGYRYRDGDPHDALVASAQGGLSVGGGWIAADVAGVLPLVAGERGGLTIGATGSIPVGRVFFVEVRAEGVPVGTTPGGGGSIGFGWSHDDEG